MTFFKLLTHDYRSPLQGGTPIWDGTTLPFTLPKTRLDTSNVECGAGWNYVSDLAAGMRIVGLWPTGQPSAVLVVEPCTDGIQRGDKWRSSTLTFTRLASDAEILRGLEQLSVPFGVHAERMVTEQWFWRQALARPKHRSAAVEAQLRKALDGRGLADWKTKSYGSARDAWDVWAARDAWDAWAARAARDAWDVWAALAAWDAWDAWAARAARDAWDAWAARAARAARAALTVCYPALQGWTEHDPLLLTTGLREAYANGLAIALPTGPKELGWAMLSSNT